MGTIVFVCIFMTVGIISPHVPTSCLYGINLYFIQKGLKRQCWVLFWGPTCGRGDARLHAGSICKPGDTGKTSFELCDLTVSTVSWDNTHTHTFFQVLPTVTFISACVFCLTTCKFKGSWQSFLVLGVLGFSHLSLWHLSVGLSLCPE